MNREILTSFSLFSVLHYGFVTMFVAAFPLGPLFALINAIIEIRLDAIKFLCHFRRPDVVRVEDIGAWYSVLEALTKVSVLVNAFVLAFTSEFIPKLLYRVTYASDRHSPGGGTLKGYVNSSLAVIDLTTLFTWENGTQPDNPTENLNYTRDYCRYCNSEWIYNITLTLESRLPFVCTLFLRVHRNLQLTYGFTLKDVQEGLPSIS